MRRRRDQPGLEVAAVLLGHRGEGDDGVGQVHALAVRDPPADLDAGDGPPPADLVERAHAAGIVVASLVGARKHAERQLAAGVDVLVAQGTEAGGHTGTVATTVLTPEVVEIADGRPVLAAGGIATCSQPQPT